MDDMELLSIAEKHFGGDINIAKIWFKKYGINGETPVDVWKRLAKLVAEMEKEENQKEWDGNFYDILKDWKFVPGGRILFALTEDIKNKTGRRKITPFNCFVLPQPEDNLESIFDIVQKAARVYSYGGGVGIDLSKIRPAGAKVNNSAIYSDGVVPFMNLYSAVTTNIAISGRRGAMLLSISDKSPDILNFINAKKDHTKMNSANISIKLSDAFMKAVETDGDWEVYFKVKDSGEEIKQAYKARAIFANIIENNWRSAEPGVLFWDRIQHWTPNEHFDESPLIGTNPCGEQPLPTWGNCNLGSINLTKFVKWAFASRADFDWEGFKTTVKSAVRFLDNVNELSIKYKLFPFQEQIDESARSRRVGLGVMGLADMFVMLGIKYDTEKAIDFSKKLFETMRNTAYEYSCELGKEKGSFKMWDYDKWAKAKFVQNLPDYIKEKAKSGLRNLTLLSVAPTGSIALLAGVSSSTEPIFSLEYHRTVNLGDSGQGQTLKFYHPLYKRFLDKKYEMDEAVWVTAHGIDWKFRIRMQGIIQQYVCTAISNTVNLPSTSTQENVHEIYMTAWKEGLKGITIYRDGCRENILTSKKSRPYELVGKTYQIKDEKEDTFYITINNILEGTKFRPFEIFINSKESNEYLNVITRLLSAIFRRTSDSEFVITQLQKSSKNEEGLLLKLAKVISDHMGIRPPTKTVTAVTNYVTKEEKSDGLQTCPSCGKKTLKKEGGCEECANPDCGYGKCAI
jgi:ribonucleoside-diphosphate reductase alpha chain